MRVEAVGEAQWARWREARLRALSDAPEAFGSTYEEWVDAPEARWRDRLRGETLDLLASEDGIPCGMASGVPGRHGSTTELISMWVDPSFRGRGVADALIDAIARWAAGRGIELRLSVMPGNGRAMAVYRRNGFVLVADEQGDALSDGSGHELIMTRALGEAS
ncbi:GNAT family N-acetyltransferase [Microbacterium sp. P04]|uniref:GNAT family N-acetyltransferase n=1 Tax=Microbacterium sp. P04 TaxID=3366947 RepID=UPI00374588F7